MISISISLFVQKNYRIIFENIFITLSTGIFSLLILHIIYFFSNSSKKIMNTVFFILFSLGICIFFSFQVDELITYFLFFWICTFLLQLASSCYFSKFSSRFKIFYLFWLHVLVLIIACLPLGFLPPTRFLSYVLCAILALIFSFFESVNAIYTMKDKKQTINKCPFYLSLVIRLDSCYMIFIKLIIHMFF
jgi:hypothetical protein